MKNLYYVVFDHTRKYSDPNHCTFGHQPICYDFAGVVDSFAKHNRVAPSEVRLFFYDQKKRWEEAQSRWVSQVDWNIPILP